MEENPFPDLHIDDTAFLNTVSSRVKCHLCHKNRRYFCYSCLVFVNGLENHMPRVQMDTRTLHYECSNIISYNATQHLITRMVYISVLYSQSRDHGFERTMVTFKDACEKILGLQFTLGYYIANYNPLAQLPVHIDIIKHRQELDGKSTAVHAALLCPGMVTIHTYPDIPAYNPQQDIIVFPSQDSLSVQDWAKTSTSFRDGKELEMRHSEARVVFIDCTWNQYHSIMSDERLQGLSKISLKSYETKFWRPNGKRFSKECLSTIEAIYYFLREFHVECTQKPYSGEYDNLLLLFKYMYMKIRDFNSGGHQLEAYIS